LKITSAVTALRIEHGRPKAPMEWGAHQKTPEERSMHLTPSPVDTGFELSLCGYFSSKFGVI
jgi:hypothetical protein